MAKTVSNGDPYENLANAIVLTAVEDYRKALKKYSRNPDSKSAKAEVDSLERFFRSQWYSARSFRIRNSPSTEVSTEYH